MTTFNDTLIAPFEQVKVMGPRVGRNKAAVEGACHNFSLAWIAAIMGNPGGSASDRMAALAKNSGGANPVLQKVFGDRWALEGADGADELITQVHGLLTKDVFAYKRYIANEILPGLENAVGKGCLYSFWFSGGVVGAEGGAHSVAFYPNKHGGQLAIHFFDPNFGEFLITGNEFASFWGILTAKYGPMRHHWMRSCETTKPVILAGR
jgi:hypothetical protein